MRRKVAFLMEEIRDKVHTACGPTVSCADIMALATHDVVVASGGKPYHVPLGRLDSFEPAPLRFVEELPPRTFSVDQLITAFRSRSLDEKDLVVLSGAHTIGKARCATFSDRFPNSDSDDFVRKLQDNCTADVNRRQDLDVTTPEEFHNKYYINLKQGKGVLTSDVQLLLNETTREYVNDFADNEWWFWNQFGSSMSKMGMLQGPQGNVGRIRQQRY
ncbi:unnamed protein product [Triticum turgidum subsp. durum]|uniref:Plant heme peroxidase family profile domain-containing protein n=1 Tax=Triticum turgidum subsp. durum TaxID=4567 RepID=A0A9R1Q3R4_TRITD|nr:unnamed protein product [Triticum turgidum subsp. durum]